MDHHDTHSGERAMLIAHQMGKAAALGAQDPEEETGPTGTTQINAIHLAVVSVRCRVICRPTR